MAEVINLNDTNPAAPANSQNVHWQKGAQTRTDPTTGLPIYPVSASVTAATSTALGVVRPDATTITVDSTGVLTAFHPGAVCFLIGNGATGTNIGPMLRAFHSFTVSKCVVLTKTSDASTALTFRINQNGTNVFSTSPTVPAGTASGTASTFTTFTTAPFTVNAGDEFSIDITSGTSSWSFTAQLET